VVSPTAHCPHPTMSDSATLLQALNLSEGCSPLPQHLPVTLTRSYEIMGIPTDCWVQLFRDQIVLGVSQLQGKVGTYILCQVEETPLDSKSRYNIATLMGKRDDALLEVYARRLTEKIAAMRVSPSDPVPPVLLGISLKPEGKDPKMFHAIVDISVNLYAEAIRNVATTRS
jgi:Proteasome assembly chaperone 3